MNMLCYVFFYFYGVFKLIGFSNVNVGWINKVFFKVYEDCMIRFGELVNNY